MSQHRDFCPVGKGFFYPVGSQFMRIILILDLVFGITLQVFQNDIFKRPLNFMTAKIHTKQIQIFIFDSFHIVTVVIKF